MISCELIITVHTYSGAASCLADFMLIAGGKSWANFRLFYEEGLEKELPQCQGGLSVGASGGDYTEVVFTQADHTWDSDGMGAVLAKGLNIDPLSAFMLGASMYDAIQDYIGSVGSTIRGGIEHRLSGAELGTMKQQLAEETGKLEALLNTFVREETHHG